MVSFESNMKLVPYIYNKYFYGLKKYKDDLFQCGYMGLWKACKRFEETKSKFSTFACKCIKNEMLLFLRQENKQKGQISGDAPINNGDVFFSLIEDEFWGDIEQSMDAKKVLSYCPKKRVLELQLADMTDQEIGDLLHVGRTQAFRLRHKNIEFIKQMCIK